MDLCVCVCAVHSLVQALIGWLAQSCDWEWLQVQQFRGGWELLGQDEVPAQKTRGRVRCLLTTQGQDEVPAHKQGQDEASAHNTGAGMANAVGAQQVRGRGC